VTAPAAWQHVPIRDIADVNPGPSRPLVDEEQVSFVPMASVREGGGGVDATATKLTGEVRRKSYRYFEEGDVIMAKITPCFENGKIAVAQGLRSGRAFGSTEFHVLRPRNRAVDPRFLKYFLESPAFMELAIRSMAGAVGQLRVPTRVVAEALIPLPPVDEQLRVVATLEELLTRLESATTSLRSAARRSDQVILSTIARLLTSTASEKWPSYSVRELASSDAHALAIGPFGSDLKVSDYQESGVPLVFVRNIRAQRFAGSDTRFVSPEKAERLRRHLVRKGDVLVTKMGDPPGDVALYDSEQEAVITADCIKITPRRGVSPRYLAIALRSDAAQQQVRAATKGVAQLKVSLARFSKVRLKVPPEPEQLRIAGVVELASSQVVTLREEISRAQRRASRLRGAMLAGAFTGGLSLRSRVSQAESMVKPRVLVGAKE
jgi:type I restriction enzyme, S subunit